MDLLLKEEHHQVRETARKFSDEVVGPRARDLDEKEEFPHDTVKQMAELGFLGLPFPEKYGGAGLDTLAYAIAVEEIARWCGSTAITLAAHVSLGCGPVWLNGNEEQKQKFLVPMAKGEVLGAFGLTESQAGSDSAGTRTRAEKVDGGYKVNGSKIYITNGSVAKFITFTARTKPEDASAMTGALMKLTRGFGAIRRSARRDSFSALSVRACCSQSLSAWFSRCNSSTWVFSEK